MITTLLAAGGSAAGQQNVFWRDVSGSSVWWNDTNSPWDYQTSNADRSRPDWNDAGNATGTANDLFFDNNYNTTSTVNGAYFPVNSLTFQSTATSSRTFDTAANGGIDLSNFIQNDSSVLHTFNNPVALVSPTGEFRARSGDLAFNGNIFTNGNSLTLTGGNAISVGGAISDVSGTGAVSVTGNPTVTLTAANTYTGGTSVESGSTLNIGNGGTSGELADTGLFRNGGGTLSNNLTVANQGTGITTIGRGSGTGNVIYHGTVALNKSANFRSGSGSGLVRFSNVISGTGGATVLGAGAIELSGDNTFSGGTTLTSGTLLVGPRRQQWHESSRFQRRHRPGPQQCHRSQHSCR